MQFIISSAYQHLLQEGFDLDDFRQVENLWSRPVYWILNKASMASNPFVKGCLLVMAVAFIPLLALGKLIKANHRVEQVPLSLPLHEPLFRRVCIPRYRLEYQSRLRENTSNPSDFRRDLPLKNADLTENIMLTDDGLLLVFDQLLGRQTDAEEARSTVSSISRVCKDWNRVLVNKISYWIKSYSSSFSFLHCHSADHIFKAIERWNIQHIDLEKINTYTKEGLNQDELKKLLALSKNTVSLKLGINEVHAKDFAFLLPIKLETLHINRTDYRGHNIPNDFDHAFCLKLTELSALTDLKIKNIDLHEVCFPILYRLHRFSWRLLSHSRWRSGSLITNQ